MKPSRVFWGILFIVIGTLLMLERADVLEIDWHSLLKFWPLILIFWGISSLVGNVRLKWVLVALAALILAIFLFGIGGLMWFHGEDGRSGRERLVQELSEPFDSTLHRVSLSLDAAAGVFTIEKPTDQLTAISTSTSFGKYLLDRKISDGAEKLALRLEGRRARWGFGGMRNSAEIRLNTSPIWELDCDVGAGRLDFDLRPYRVERVVINAGASTVRLRLGTNVPEARVHVHAGASSIRVTVPSEAGCEVTMGNALASKQFDGFEKVESGLYRTDNFSQASRRIFIDVEAGVSRMKVTRE